MLPHGNGIAAVINGNLRPTRITKCLDQFSRAPAGPIKTVGPNIISITVILKPHGNGMAAASIALLKNIVAEGGESYYSYTDRSFADVLTMATLFLDELDPEDAHDVALIAGIWREGAVHG